MRKFIFILLFFFVTSSCFAATQLLKTVKPSGGDYTSLEACMNANEQNLMTNDRYFDVEIDGDWSGGADTTAVTIHNYTTDATRYINVYTKAGDARHNGIFLGKSTAYELTAILTMASKYTTINGLQFNNAVNLQTYTTITNITFKNNILKHTFSLIILGHNGYSCGPNYWFNNIFISTNTDNYSNVVPTSTDSTEYFYSNTFYGNLYGNIFYGNGANITFKNNIAIRPGSSRTCWNGTYHADSDYNLSSDTTAPGANSQKSVTPTFVNTGIDDYHLDSTDTAAKDKGTDTSGEASPLNFTDDIDGATRTGTWDIGADEVISAAARRFFIFD